MDIQTDIIVVGAGTAGSYFSWKMAEKGYSVKVVEQKKKGTLGEHIDIFHFDEIRFEQFDVPLPEGEEFVGQHSTGLAWPPDPITDPKVVNYSFYVMRLPLFIERLNGYAIKAGADFSFETTFISPQFNEKGKISGIKAKNKADEEINITAKIVVDCSGIESVVRTSLPSNYGVEVDKIDPKDALYVILQYWENIERTDFPEGLNFYPFHKTFCNPSHGEGAILGVGQPISFKNSENIQNDFLKERFPQKHDISKICKGRTPFRRPPYSIVADNLVILGDAAFLTKPFSGEGVTSGFTACKIAIDEIDNVLKKGDHLDQTSLWNINKRYFTDQGAKFVELFAQVPVAAELSRKDVNFLFKKDIIFGGDDFTKMNRDFENQISFIALLKMIFKFSTGIITRQFSFGSLKKLLGAMSVSGKLRKHYEQYPDINSFDQWVQISKELWGEE